MPWVGKVEGGGGVVPGLRSSGELAAPLLSALMRDIAALTGYGSPPEAVAAPHVLTLSVAAATAANPVTVMLLL